MDRNGYPDDNELDKIAKWDPMDWRGLFDFMNSIWHMPDWGWTERQPTKEELKDDDNLGLVFEISTGGWSGNESIIYAFEQNFIAWSFYWESSRRGGHYVFQITKTQGGKWTVSKGDAGKRVPDYRRFLSECYRQCVSFRNIPYGGIKCPKWLFVRILVDAMKENPDMVKRISDEEFEIMGGRVISRASAWVSIFDVNGREEIEFNVDENNWHGRLERLP